MQINTYDIDGVINMGEFTGLRPGPYDVIITGRSVDESEYTLEWLRARNIYNKVYFSPWPFDAKTRTKSGEHKAEVINGLLSKGYDIGIHFEDDETQASIIESNTTVQVVRIVHDLVEKENVWHGPNNTRSTEPNR